MLVADMTGRLDKLVAEWDRKRAQIRTAAELEARNSFVRQKFLEMLGPFPARNPLNAVVVKTLTRDAYRVENVMFQSRPDFWVTGNLYVPASGNGPFPAIISPCGHYPLARMTSVYQSVYQNLVRSGFVVLAYDPIGQGERRQYWNPETNITEVGGPVHEHSMPGQILLLMGENLTNYRVWDGMRAIDYLLTRPEVDAKRIGCAGHSGGGTLTKFLSVADERIQCSAIIEGGTANRWPIHLAPWEPFGPADVEQNVFPSAIYGIDNVDLHIAIGPRPLLVATEGPTPAWDNAVEAIRDRYHLLAAPDKFNAVSADDPHSWTMKLRLATTDWFSRWFYDHAGPATEPPFALEPAEALYCTPNGSLRYSHTGQTIFSLILNKQASLPPARPVPQTPQERQAMSEEIREKVRTLLRYEKSDQALGPRLTVTTPRKGYKIEKVQFLSEPGIYIPAWVYIPENAAPPLTPILHVSDESLEDEGMEFEGEEDSGQPHSAIDEMVRKGNLVVAVDVRGIGSTRPAHGKLYEGGEFGQLFDTETALAYLAWYMNESLLGKRVIDVVRSVDYVFSRPEADSQRLRVIGKGMGGLWCLYAAALDSRIRSLISVRSLLSYRTLGQTDRYTYGANVFVPEILLSLDLPEVAAAISTRPLALLSPVGAMQQPVEEYTAEETYQWTRSVYLAAGIPNHFYIKASSSDLETATTYLNLFDYPERIAGGHRGR